MHSNNRQKHLHKIRLRTNLEIYAILFFPSAMRAKDVCTHKPFFSFANAAAAAYVQLQNLHKIIDLLLRPETSSMA